jgi:hypothetical protein
VSRTLFLENTMAPKRHDENPNEDFESPEQLDQHNEDNQEKEPRDDDESPEI